MRQNRKRDSWPMAIAKAVLTIISLYAAVICIAVALMWAATRWCGK